MKKRKSFRRSARAFTIAEIIVVVVIIGVLAAIIAPRLFSRVAQAKSTTAASNAAAIANAVKLFWADCGPPPAGASLASFLYDKPSDSTIAEHWQGPYLDNAEQFKDPWGREFVMIVPGNKNHDFDIVSYGADGQAGGDGENKDIVKP